MRAIPSPDKKWIFDQIVSELDNGQFYNAGRVGDAILRDARIRGAYEQRMAGIFSAPLEVLPARDTAQGNKIADDIKADWPKMFPRASLEELHRYGISQGIGIAEKIWDTSTKPWTFRIKVWHPQFYLWIWTTRSYYLVTYDRGLIRIPEKSTQWIVYTPYGYDRAFLLGNLRALLDPYMFRGWNKSDWGNYNEIYGKPIRQAIVPQQSIPAEEKKFVDAVSKMGSNTTVKAKQDKDGNKYAVELIEAKSTGWKTFESALEWCNEEIAQVLLGQTMSMDGQGGLGSQEEPGKAVRADIRASDNEKLVKECLGEAVAQLVGFNYGNPDLAPVPYYDVDPSEDELKSGQAEAARATASSARILSKITTPAEEAIAIATGKPIAETIDVESRQRMMDIHAQTMEQEAQNGLDAAKNPEPPPSQKYDDAKEAAKPVAPPSE